MEGRTLSFKYYELQRANGPQNYNHSFQGRPSVPFLYKINVSDTIRHPRTSYIGHYDSTEEFRTLRTGLGCTAVRTYRRRMNELDYKTYIWFVSDIFHFMRKTCTTRKQS